MQESQRNVPTCHLRMRPPHYSWFQTIRRLIWPEIPCYQWIWNDQGLSRQTKRCSQREKSKDGLLWSLSLSITIQWKWIHLLRWTNHCFKWMRAIFFQLEKNIGQMCNPLYNWSLASKILFIWRLVHSLAKNHFILNFCTHIWPCLIWNKTYWAKLFTA